MKIKKNIFAFAFVAIMLFQTFTTLAFATSKLDWSGDKVSKSSDNLKTDDVVPDKNLKAAINKVLKRPSATDITEANMKEIVFLNASYSKIKDTTGLEYATNLKTLLLYENNLTNIDLSKNTNLSILDLGNNNISSIDLSKNVKLSNLTINNNNLTNLDLQHNTALNYLDVKENELSSLDLSKNTYLDYLDISETNISSIDLSKNLMLVYFISDKNRFSNIDLSKNTNLAYLSMNDNNLRSVSLFENIDLSTILLNNNNISSLKLPENTSQIYAEIENQNIIVEDVVAIDNRLVHQNLIKYNDTYVLPRFISDNGVYEEPSFIWNNLPSTTTNVNYTFESNLGNRNIVFSGKVLLDVSFQKWEDINVIPDKNLMGVINQQLGKSAGSAVTVEDMEKIVSLSANLSNISDTTGIEYAINLEHLSLSTNNISSINLSKNTKLLSLNLRNNYLTEIDLSKNKNLTEVFLQNNNISNLNVEGLENLTKIMATNQSIVLDDIIVKDFALTYKNNVLLNGNLVDINSISNSGTYSVPNVSWSNLSKLLNNVSYRFDETITEGVSSADSKSFSGKVTLNITFEQTGQENDNVIPDINLKNAINKQLGRSNDNDVTVGDMKMLTTLYATGIEISNTTGLEHGTNIKYLYLDQNNISQIDLSKLTKLEALDLSSNNLTDIDLSNNLNLNSLSLSYNNISSLDLDSNINISYLSLKNNKLSKINVLHLSDLVTFEITHNNLSSLDLSGLEKLITADASDQVINIDSIFVQNSSLIYKHNILLNNKLVGITAISDMGTYLEPNITWNNIDQDLSSLSYSFYQPIELPSVDGSTNSKSFSGTVNLVISNR